ncbi:MAG: VCBS repeat-containing protein [Bacteroidota bacterium]
MISNRQKTLFSLTKASFILMLSFFLLPSCQTKKKDTLFHLIDSQYANIDFVNLITESDNFNVLDYEYLYNGGGLGVGDFNADGLPDLFFAGNMVSSKLYLNKGNFQFEDVTEQAGVMTNAWCTGVAVVDINQDGLDDIHVATAHDNELQEATNYFFINRTTKTGEVRFENLAAEMGLFDDSYSMQAAFLDYDKDLDLLLINNSMESYPRNSPIGQRKDGSGKSTDRLYRNDGVNTDGLPQFSNVSEEANIQTEGWSLGVVVLDVNQDTYPDLYIANDFLSNDLLYINQKDGTFQNEIEAYFKHQSHNSMGITAADINNDALEDLLVLDMLPEDNLRHKTMFAEIPFERFRKSLERGYQPQFIRNVLQVNNGKDIRFSDWAYFSGLAATDWSWSPLLADFDNDGLRDAYITNGYKKDVTDLDFINYSGGFNVFGTVEEKRAKLIDQLNKMEGIKKTNRFFQNMGDLHFEDRTEVAGLGYPSYSNGAVYVDLDVDGDLDIVTNNLNETAFLFENKSQKNYIHIKLPNDATGYGSKVYIYSPIGTQYATFYPQRAYLSSVDPSLHFGLDSLEVIDSIKIIFPNNQVYKKTTVSSNQILSIHPKMANDVWKTTNATSTPTPIQSAKYIPVIHLPQERPFDDFKKWPLHVRSYSQTGTIIATTDVNSDGKTDLFIGGTSQQNPQIFLQTNDGNFTKQDLKINGNPIFEDVAAIFFDADADGDEDLYCVRGSSEYYAQTERYQDAYFENMGAGELVERPDYLPLIRSAGSCAIPIDYDRDGDLDLFVGGRIDALNYPISPRSFLLKNEGNRFVDATPEILQHIGMVTDALAVDLDKDGWEDLVLVGEWMPIQMLHNEEGSFSKATPLAQSSGWWNCIASADMDKDGDQDLVVGNWGLNNPFKASPAQPLSIYAKDYDENGQVEAIITYYNQGKSYVFHPRETLSKQLPSLKNLFPDFKSYGSTEAKILLEASGKGSATVSHVHQLASVYVENKGNRQFDMQELPYATQAAPVFDWLIKDINQDGHLDILGVGNFKSTEILTGWYNAANGITLLGDGSGHFDYLSAGKSGFYVPEAARTIQTIKKNAAEDWLLVGCRSDSLKWLVWERESS